MKKDKDSISKVNNEQVTRAREKEAIFINHTELDEASINKFYKFLLIYNSPNNCYNN